MIDLASLNPLHIWRRETLPRVFTGHLQWCRCHQWYDANSQTCRGCSFNPEPESVSYHLNQQGYRCKEFSAINHDAFKILTMGCSETFGMGIPLALTYGEQLATMLRESFAIEVEVINLGATTQSIDFITRVLSQSIGILRPHYVFCLLPEMSRREYITFKHHVITEPFMVHTSDNDALLTLGTVTWDFFSMVKNVAMIELILHDTPWSWDTWMGDEWKLTGFEKYFDLTHYRNQAITIDNRGKAADDIHNGVPYHTYIANDLMTDPHLLMAIERYK